MTLTLFRLINRLLELLCLVLSPLLLLLLWSKKYLAALDWRAPDTQCGILIHAASVGEVNAARPLVESLQERYPAKALLITTTTLSGLEHARRLGLPARLAVLDLALLRSRQLRSINPGLILIVETEIWPNLLDQASKQGRDVVFVNARLSGPTLIRYSKAKRLLSKLGRSVKAIFAQTEEDADRFRQLFSAPVSCAGNLKYALTLPDHDPAALRALHGYQPEDFIVCLGSSRPGEEALLRDVLSQLRAQIPRLRLIVAPRHLQRLQEVRTVFPEAGSLSDPASQDGTAPEILIIDTMGRLTEFYSLCDLALVGGAWADCGGHNPLEPAFYGKATLIGPHHSSCRGSVNALKAAEGIEVVAAEELEKIIIDLYRDPAKRVKMGLNARNCVARNSTALEKHLSGLQPWLSH